jgi:catechol 2,3-dioxygenase-like lactoylglutathione lyase family enzyme
MLFTGLSTIGQISIPVQELESAVNFYRDSLGMDFLFQVPNMAFFDCGGIRILLAVPEKGDSDRRSSIIYFKVEFDHLFQGGRYPRGDGLASRKRCRDH